MFFFGRVKSDNHVAQVNFKLMASSDCSFPNAGITRMHQEIWHYLKDLTKLASRLLYFGIRKYFILC